MVLLSHTATLTHTETDNSKTDQETRGREVVGVGGEVKSQDRNSGNESEIWLSGNL